MDSVIKEGGWMKSKIMMMCLLFLTACGTTDMKNASMTTEEKPSSQMVLPTKDDLAGVWRLTSWTKHGQKQALPLGSDAQGLTIQLDKQNQQLMVVNGCNMLRASFDVVEGRLLVGGLMSGRMLCEPALMQIDNLAGRLLHGHAQSSFHKTANAWQWVIDVEGERYHFSQVSEVQ